MLVGCRRFCGSSVQGKHCSAQVESRNRCAWALSDAYIWWWCLQDEEWNDGRSCMMSPKLLTVASELHATVNKPERYQWSALACVSKTDVSGMNSGLGELSQAHRWMVFRNPSRNQRSETQCFWRVMVRSVKLRWWWALDNPPYIGVWMKWRASAE